MPYLREFFTDVELFYGAWTSYGAWLKFLAATDTTVVDGLPLTFYTDKSFTEDYFKMREKAITLVGPKWLVSLLKRIKERYKIWMQYCYTR